METMIDIDELDGLGKYLQDSYKEITSIKENITTIVNSIPSDWIGYDSEAFVSKTSVLTNQIDETAEKTNVSGDFLCKASSDYKQNEDKYESIMKGI